MARQAVGVCFLVSVAREQASCKVTQPYPAAQGTPRATGTKAGLLLSQWGISSNGDPVRQGGIMEGERGKRSAHGALDKHDLASEQITLPPRGKSD